MGEVLQVSYLNPPWPQLPEASDHGQVLVRLRLYDKQIAAIRVFCISGVLLHRLSHSLVVALEFLK
jgi:hypothetical protein